MRLVLFTLPACLVLTAAPALAEKPSAPEPFAHVAVRLSFKTIDGCPGERAFRAEVASWVGYDPFSPEGEDLITIWFERAGPLFASSFTLTTPDQTSGIHREFEATCTGLFRTMGIGVGLAIAPSDGPPPLPAPPPPKRSFRLVGGLDGIFTPFIAPSAITGISAWAGVDLLKLPLAFELDLRSS